METCLQLKRFPLMGLDLKTARSARQCLNHAAIEAPATSRKTVSQWASGAKLTLYQRRCNIIFMSCARWAINDQYNNNTACHIVP